MMMAAYVGNAQMMNPDYLPQRMASRWITLTKRMWESKETLGPRFSIEKCRVLEFGDGYVLVKPEYFHPSQNSTGPHKELVTETAEEIVALMDQ